MMNALFRGLILLFLSAVALADIAVERISVPMPGWSAGAKPARVVVLSDIHAAATDGAKLDGMVRQVRQLNPAVVALLGDYRCGLENTPTMSPEQIAAHLAPLAQDSRVLYIMGNHDTGEWGKKIEKAFARIGFTAADKKQLRHDFGRGRAVLFEGYSFRFSGGRAAIESALPKKNTVVPFILLVHSPYYFLKYSFPRVDFVLAGHTHGGQVCWPNGMPMVESGGMSVEMQRGGMHRTPNGKPLYITRGIGESRTALRLNCPREITLIELIGQKK